MINPEHVHFFCDNLRRQFGIGFQKIPTQYGFKVIGEYLTRSGQVMSMVIDVYRSRVDVQIFDYTRRPVFTETTRGNINNNSKIYSYLQRSVNS